MERKIEYAEQIVVGVRRNHTWSWYLSAIELWFLDYRKWAALFGALAAQPETAPSRFGIVVVDDDDTTERFLEHMRPHLISTADLRRLLEEARLADPDNQVECYPSLFVDFDRKIFKSYYYEPVYPEKYVPDGWTGTYEPFLDDIPEAERYWM